MSRAVGLLSPAIGVGPGFGNPVADGFMQGVQALGLVGLLEQLVSGAPDLLDPESLTLVRANYACQDDTAMRAVLHRVVGAVPSRASIGSQPSRRLRS